jgi:alpha-glucosidase (family GH31 glycosyl hydrolase)
MKMRSSRKNQVHRFRFGDPIHTDALAEEWREEEISGIYEEGNELQGIPGAAIFPKDSGWEIKIPLDSDQIIWGLAEQMGPINKRGRRITLYNSDVFQHVPEKRSLYGSHAFVMIFHRVGGFSFYLDHPGQTDWDLGFTDPHILSIQVPARDSTSIVLKVINLGIGCLNTSSLPDFLTSPPAGHLATIKAVGDTAARKIFLKWRKISESTAFHWI